MDESKVGNITDDELKDRVVLGGERLITVVTVINRQTDAIISKLDIHARGIAEDNEVFREIKPKIAAAIVEAVADNPLHTDTRENAWSFSFPPLVNFFAVVSH